MPIRLTWTAPINQGSGIVGYVLYKTISPGPLTPFDLFQIFPGNVFSYDDYAYDRRTLQENGYIYKITALATEGESDFSLANVVFSTHSFEDFVHREEWEFGFTGVDMLELLEQWEFTFPTTPVQKYLESWEDLVISWTEPWEYSLGFSNTQTWIETWEYSFGFSNTQTWIEFWEYSFGFSNTQTWIELWEYPFSFSNTQTWIESWEYTSTQQYLEGWDS